MNKSLIALTLGVVALGGLLAYPAFADAYRGDPTVQGPYYSDERHEAMEKAFETKNYEAWKNLMKDKGRITQIITKDNFAKFAEAHELSEQGKTKEAAQIRQDLGLGLKDGTGPNMGKGRCDR